LFGGRIAEELCLDDISAGASNDIARATDIARKMVAEWGMSKEFGLLSYGEGGEVFVGRDYQRKQSFSEDIANKIDVETKLIIDTAHNKALEILKEHKELIAKLETVLLDRETIYNEEFELLYQGKSVEEVSKIIEDKEREKREYQERARKEAETLKVQKDKLSQLETARALLRTGVINQKDFDKIQSALNEKEENDKTEQTENSNLNSNSAKEEEKQENHQTLDEKLNSENQNPQNSKSDEDNN